MIELIQKLKKKYPNVVPLNTDETIYESVEIFNGTPIKINYFDFSQQIPESIEDMQRYHNDYILPSYYKESGSIQWNYYIYFIYDDKEKIISNDVLTLIEKNKDYARKIIFNKQEFEDFLEDDISNFYNKVDSIGSDLISRWCHKLDNNNLSLVYDENIPKSRVVEEFILDKKQQNKKKVKQKSNAELDLRFPSNNTFIDEVHLNNYRKYPLKRNFAFGKVNLIHGVNGAGKTSLLEAIEIVTCGKTYRSGGSNEPFVDSLELVFSGKQYSIVNNTNTTYQERDKKWYGSTNTWGNKLYENFNKFNFYHADSAYGISTGLDINNIVKNLVLGKEVAFYEKRINDVIEKFETEKKSLSRESRELKPKISKTELEIEELDKSIFITDELENQLVAILKSLNWKNYYLNLNKEFDFNKLFLDIAPIEKCIVNIKELSYMTEVYNFSDIRERYNNISKEIIHLSSSIEKIIKIQKEQKRFLKEVESFSSKIANIQRFSEWLNVENISSLIGLEEKLNKMKQRCIKLESLIYNIPSNNELQKYSDDKVSFLTYLTKFTTSKDSLEKKRDNYIQELKKLEDDIGTLNAYKNNLQQYALKVLEASDKMHCPVCNTKFKEIEIMELIYDITKNIDDIEKIQKLKKDIDFLNKQIEIHDKNITTVDMLIQVGKKLLPELDFGISTTKSVTQEFIKFSGILKKLKKDIDYLEKEKEKFSAMGINEIEYSSFVKNYDKRYSKDFGILTQKSLEKIKQKYIQDLLSKNDTLKSFEKKIAQEEEIIEKIKVVHQVDINKNHELLDYLSKKRNQLLDMKKQEMILKRYMYPKTTEIKYLVSKVLELIAMSKQFSEFLIQNKKSVFVIKSLTKQLELDKKRDKNLDTNLSKLHDALVVLTQLDSSENRLSDFFKKNAEAILNVFMNVHAPKEFDDLSFNDGKIMLKRIGSDKYDPITEISTGQKSALALSIFLTMNKNAQNAPKYILLDDPVSDIDDINILAFFDFLREISISGERQIFFVTASSKIANLFKKKFDFLGNDFQYYHLER